MNNSIERQKLENGQVKILQAFVEDAEEILGLQKLAFRSEAELYNDYNIAPLKQTLDEIRADFKTYVFLKAICGGKIVGTVRAYEKDGICYVGRLAVLPEMQNQGIGAVLMKRIEGYFKPERFELFVGSKSEQNKHLYQKLGYSIFKKEPYGCGSAIEIFYMEKKLLTMPDIKIAGIKIRTSNRDEMSVATAKIPLLWKRFFQENIGGNIPHKKSPSVLLGVYTNYESDHNGLYDLIVGMEVDRLESLPDGVIGMTIAPGKYLLFTAEGPMPKALIDTWGRIWDYFGNGSIEKRRYSADFEIHHSNEKVDIYIAV